MTKITGLLLPATAVGRKIPAKFPSKGKQTMLSTAEMNRPRPGGAAACHDKGVKDAEKDV